MEEEINNYISNEEINRSLFDENIDYYKGPLFWSNEFIYSGYIKIMLQRILFEQEYIWVKGYKIASNPVEKS